jgi:hypothetical protein
MKMEIKTGGGLDFFCARLSVDGKLLKGELWKVEKIGNEEIEREDQMIKKFLTYIKLWYILVHKYSVGELLICKKILVSRSENILKNSLLSK